jgi:hypothetical protein
MRVFGVVLSHVFCVVKSQYPAQERRGNRLLLLAASVTGRYCSPSWHILADNVAKSIDETHLSFSMDFPYRVQLRRALRECSAEWLDHGRVPIDKIVKEILRTCPELDSSIGGKDSPAHVDEDRRTVCGVKDDLTCVRLRRGAEIAGDGKHSGERGVLRVGRHGTRQRIAELCEGSVLVGDAARQVAILVIGADGNLLECAAVEDIEGAGAASTLASK